MATTRQKREKRVVVAGITADMAEEAFARYAKADAEKKRLEGEMELKIARVRETYQERLATLDAERDDAFLRLQTYATEQHDTLFDRRKSLEMTHGTIGFRTGTPKLKTLRGFTWASALVLVRELLPGYVRTVEEIDKARLIADRTEMEEQMGRCGLCVAQDESFYVEAKE